MHCRLISFSGEKISSISPVRLTRLVCSLLVFCYPPTVPLFHYFHVVNTWIWCTHIRTQASARTSKHKNSQTSMAGAIGAANLSRRTHIACLIACLFPVDNHDCLLMCSVQPVDRLPSASALVWVFVSVRCLQMCFLASFIS